MRVIDFFDKGAALDPDRTALQSDTGTVTYLCATGSTSTNCIPPFNQITVSSGFLH